MAKLAALKPRIGALPPRIGQISREVRERERSQQRDANVDWRSWYKTARWRALRLQILARDLYTCQRTGVLLAGTYPAPNSPVVDHKEAHRGDPDLFWSEANLHAVSKAYHDGLKQSMERGGKASPHPEWFKPSLIPLTIVCGPPASGKSTYIRDRAGPDDLVIDIDMIASDLAGTETHGWDRDKYLNASLFKRNDIIGQLSRPSRWPAAWLIVGEPKARWREWWQRKLKPREIVVVETPEAICVDRVKADPQRPYKGNTDGIVRWWLDYAPRPGETVIRP